jgi:1-acyl-sn-glycerol-3-phosphate acyltransferase
MSSKTKSPAIYPDMHYRRFRLFAVNLVRLSVNLLLRLEYVGLENIPASGPAILISNHTSMADMLVIQPPFKPWICWVAKKELFSNPLTRGVFKWLGCIPVDRDKTDLLAARGIFTALRDKLIIGMFPQGTRVKPACIPLVRPRSGAIHFAIKTGAPILPVAVEGRFRFFAKIRIVYGPMFDLGLDPRSHYAADDLHRLTVDVMRRVYALIGYDYQPSDEAAEAAL